MVLVVLFHLFILRRMMIYLQRMHQLPYDWLVVLKCKSITGFIKVCLFFPSFLQLASANHTDSTIGTLPGLRAAWKYDCTALHPNEVGCVCFCCCCCRFLLVRLGQGSTS